MVRTNLCPNPSFAYGTNGWAKYAPSSLRIASDPAAWGGHERQSPTYMAVDVPAQLQGQVATPGVVPISAGQALAVSALGLIPAHAGKTGFKAGDDLASGAHPRSRGENAPALVAARIARGSSPLTRGKRRGSRPHRPYHGLIPAHAGKTGRTATTQRS